MTQASQMTAEKTHYRTCNICEAMCGIEVRYQGDEVLSIRPDKEDPLSRGHICPKAVALQDFYHDPDRLTHPLRRQGSDWTEISWEAALTEIGERFRGIQDVYGRQAIATYLGNPNAHNLGSLVSIFKFRKALGSTNHFSSASADQMPQHVANKHMFGHGSLIAVPDIDRTDYLFILGANPVVSNGSMMTAPGYPKRMKAVQGRGGKIVVVDPRRTETAEKADEHHFIKPNTDAFLLLAMNHVLFAEDRIRLNHLEGVVIELEQLRQAVAPYTPERVAEITGIDSNTITRLAREMSDANSAVLYSRLGACTQAFGGVCQWLTITFNILSGNFDRPGGAMFATPAFDLVKITDNTHRPNTYGSLHSRVRGLPYNNNEFPVAVLAEEILTPGQDQIRGLVTLAGNPVISAPNGPKLAEAFSQLDFMVSADIYLNETTRHADIILPAATGLQIPQYDVAFHINAVRNTAKFADALFQPKGEQKEDWEILKLLNDAINGVSDDGLTPTKILDQALQNGPYKDQGMSVALLRENPHGIDLGPLQAQRLPDRLQTPDGRLHLAPALYLEDLNRLERTSLHETDNSKPLSLISRRLPRSHNSWTQNSYRLVKGKNPCTLLIHPKDAENNGVESGAKALVSSRVGAIQVEVEVSDEMMPGVVCIPHGWGHDVEDTRLNTAKTQPGVNINELTDETLVDELTGNAQFSGIPVSIRAA
ncbi:MAG: molybdopterin-dependent oxidoreductase [Pseudomonadota bacterium]